MGYQGKDSWKALYMYESATGYLGECITYILKAVLHSIDGHTAQSDIAISRARDKADCARIYMDSCEGVGTMLAQVAGTIEVSLSRFSSRDYRASKNAALKASIMLDGLIRATPDLVATR